MDKQTIIIIILAVGGMLFSVSLFLLITAVRHFFYRAKQHRPSSSQSQPKEEERFIVSLPDSSAERYEIREELEELKELRNSHIISKQEFEYQERLLLRKHSDAGLPRCQKTEEDKEIDELVRLKKEGLLTEAAFKREVDRIKFKKYLDF